ncbi:hypothetical protein ILYODFUR_009950 [Ilyodon furcidens]|uniref:Uncharacterized protein n=1 Tax=Ilyodon furcidens TaxID=33524 RepID=A0ABV0TIN1_9TELE
MGVKEERRRRRSEGGCRRRRTFTHCYRVGELLRPPLLHVNFPGESFDRRLFSICGYAWYFLRHIVVQQRPRSCVSLSIEAAQPLSGRSDYQAI